MEKKAASAIMLTLLLTSMLTLAFNIQPVSSELSLPIESSVRARQTLTEGKPNSNVRDGRSEFNGDDRCSTQFVIRINNRISDAYTQLMGIIAKYDCEVVNTVSMAGEIIAVVADVSSAEAPSLTREMIVEGLSSYIEHRMKFQSQIVPNDPYWSLQWGPQQIEADWAWNTTIGDPSVLVAVIDTGIDWDHPDLAANYVALGYDWVNNDTDPMDDNGHGTHCAGIIAAVINNSIGVAGLAQVRIMAEKGLDQYGQGYEDDLANAIIHAVDQGADILSNSWGGYGESALIHDAVKYAYDSGVLVVAAAGNEATSSKVYPAAFDEVIAVSATDEYDNPAYFTNFGEWVELAAPGVGIYSTYWDDTYRSMSGTSMSTPHVSGVAALIWSQFPKVTRDWVRAQLRYSADDLGDPGFDDYYGYGRINARRAVEQAPPDHDLLIFDWERPPRVKLGELATFNITVLNFGISDETNVEVQLLVNSSLIDSTYVAFLPGGGSATVGLSWTPTVEGTYNVTAYVVPVPEETITQNNLITEIITVVAPPPEANWILLATDPDEGVGTSLKAIYGQLYSDIIYFKVEHYRPWTTINDIDTGIFIDADQDPSTGLPDGFYPGQNTGIGADYVIVVGLQATGMWKWDPIAEMWDLGNPISLAYLDAPEGSNVFVVGVVLASVETAGSLDCAVADVVSGWDWMPDAGYFTWSLIRYEHELTVFLEAPQRLQPGETSLLNATVYNVGLNNETDVELQLLINDTIVNNATIPELVNSTSYTIDYLWTPTVEGIYNLTAYAPPVPGENVTANNLKSVIVLVQVLPDILIVNDDDGSSLVHGTSLPEFESALTAAGYDYWVWNESSMGNPPLDFLTEFQLVIWTCGDYWNRAVDPTDAVALESYLAQGGNILIEGEDIGYDHHADDFMVNVAHAIYQVDDTGAPGLTVTDPTHPVTFGLPTGFSWLTDPRYDDGVSPTNGGAEVIQYTGTTWTAVTVFEGVTDGSVVYYAFPLYCLAQSHGETLAINSINWLLGIRYEHELAIALEAPDFLEPGDSSLLNATVYNRGLNNETNVELFLLINGTEVNSTAISELLTDSSYTLSYLWTPTIEGTYNVTAYVPPVPGENITANNSAMKIVTVRFVKYVLWDDVHDGDDDSLTGNYLSLYQLLSSSGFVVDELTSGTINSGVLAPYDILVLIDPEYDFSSSEISDIHDWMTSGGALIVIPDTGYPATLNTIMASYGVQLTGLDTSYDTTTNIAAHPITQNVGSIYYDRAWQLAVSSPSEALAWTLEYYAFLSATTGGEVVVISDSNIMDNYGLGVADNTQLMLNIFNWIGVRYEHELTVTLQAPTFLQPGDSSLLNATVYNRGLNNETHVELFLLINGTVVNSTTIPELPTEEFYTINYLWTPTVEATYNVTAYAPPVPDENVTANNFVSKMVRVRHLPRLLVVDTPLPEDTGALDMLGYEYTLVTPTEFATVDLYQYNVLFIGWEPGDTLVNALLARESEIADWVAAGNGIVALAEFDEANRWAWLPLWVSGSSGFHADTVHILNPAHPVMSGLTDAELSGWGNSYHGYFISYHPAWEALAQGVEAAQPITLAATYGAGRIAITDQDPDFHLYYGYEEGAGKLLRNMIEWLLTPPVPLVANFTWTPPIPKVGEPVTFDASASTPNGGMIVKYEWNFSDGGTATGKTVTHTYVNPGTHIVTLNVTDSQGLWDIEQKQIQVVQPHGPEAEFTAAPEAAKVGELVKFDASSSLSGWNGTHNMPITEYRWDFGDGNRTTSSTPVIYHRFSGSGIYYVTLTVYAPGATPETDSTTCRVTVIAIPVGGYSISIQVQTKTEPMIPYIALIAALTAVLTKLRPKTKRKR
jgi:thermitase